MTTKPLTTFTHALVLCNPVSTSAAQAKPRIVELQQFFGKEHVIIIETVAGGTEANRSLIRAHAKQLGPRTLLCIAAGDGTVSMVVETLVQDAGLPEKARATPILPLWGGNANDLAHMLNGNVSRSRLREVLTWGSVIAIRPLACTLTNPDGAVETRIAACYASFGATAFAAARLNEPDVRSNRWQRVPGGRAVAEFVAGFLALVDAPAFIMKEQGSEKHIYERTFTNGSRFAKVERLPLKLTDDAFLQHTLEEKRFLSVIPRMWEAMQKRLVSRFRQNSAKFTIEQAVFAQFDGEPTKIAAGTEVDITLSSRPFYALSVVLGEDTTPKD
jgi:diacylglycerol kinase family enzyme